jgi:hypothetical protein
LANTNKISFLECEMNILKKTLALCSLLIAATPVFAQTVTLGTPTPSSQGPGGVVTVPVTFDDGDGTPALGGLTVDIMVNTSQFSTVAINCAGNTVGALIASCTLPSGAGGGHMRLNFSGDSLSPFVDGTMGTLTLTVAPGAVPNPAQAIDGTINGAGNVDGSADVPLDQVTIVDTTLNIQGPAYSSSPVSGGATEFSFSGVQNSAIASQNLTITNTGIGTLSGECTETADPDNLFSITNGTYSAGAGLNDTVTVNCDSSGSIATHTGTMSCTHNAGNVASPVEYDLSCNITAGPQPAYTSSNPTAGGAINLGPTEAGDPDPSQVVTITNTGESGTTLTGSCSLTGADSEITLSSTAQFNILQGAPGVNRTVTCDAAVQGNYTNTLSCTHNGSNTASPVEYAVSCEVTEAGGAVFDSDPDAGAVDVANGADVVEGDTDPVRNLTFFNLADPGDQLLDLTCDYTGDVQITPSSANLDVLIEPGAQSGVSFTCDTAAAGSYTGTYTCSYQNGGVEAPTGAGTQAIYNLSCDVRAPEAQVEQDPPSGTAQNAAVSPGGSTSFSFDFTEVNDEGEDGSIVSCSVGGGQGFTVNGTPTLPADVLSGQTVTITVDFTDPGGADSFSDTLTCLFSDSDDEDTEVSWPLSVTIGGNAQITVLKDFTDDNPGEVTVELDCNTGLILDQDKDITEDGIGVTFIVTDYDAGELDCTVTEVPVAGYSADYEVSGDSAGEAIDDPDEDAGCHWADMAGGVENTCTITNSPDPVEVVVHKEWVIEGNDNATDMEFELDLYCEATGMTGPNAHNDGGDYWHGWDYSEGNDTFVWEVIPFYPSTSCYVEEYSIESYVEVDNGCDGFTVSAGNGFECTVTNSVFYEGIPTLSQYGMMLLALLMLGVGFVSVRRYS